MKKRGRPAGPPTVSLLVRMPAELREDLGTLSEAHFGASLNSLMNEAIRQFIDAAKEDPRIADHFAAARQELRIVPADEDKQVG